MLRTCTYALKILRVPVKVDFALYVVGTVLELAAEAPANLEFSPSLCLNVSGDGCRCRLLFFSVLVLLKGVAVNMYLDTNVRKAVKYRHDLSGESGCLNPDSEYELYKEGQDMH